MKREIEGLFAGELIDKTYSILLKKHNPWIIRPPKQILAKIGDDSDYHRTSIGYMGYDSIGLFQFNDDNYWAIAKGNACGKYPSDPYNNDLIAIALRNENPNKRDLSDAIKRGEYFKNSLLYSRRGMFGGGIAVGEFSSFKPSIIDRIKESTIEKFIISNPKNESKHSSLTSDPSGYTSSIRYTPEFANVLAGTIEFILRNSRA